MTEPIDHDDDSTEEVLERLRKFARANPHGGCKIFSLGSGCVCALCDLDRLADRIDPFEHHPHGMPL